MGSARLGLSGPDGTLGNRFGDPDATYRVLYASSQRLGCFVETLARFRIDRTLLAESRRPQFVRTIITVLTKYPPGVIFVRYLGIPTEDGAFIGEC